MSIATLGSHCALQVLKGAHDEGQKSILICEKKRESLYRRFDFIDDLILVDTFLDILEPKCKDILHKEDAILIPHGTMIAQMTDSQIESIDVPIFGNKHILRWESDRLLKEKLMKEAKLRVPDSIQPNDIDSLVIAKRHGAAGGKGYFMTSSFEDFKRQCDVLISEGLIANYDEMYIQKYVSGVLAYLQYFFSPLTDTLEFFGADRRLESDIEGLSRIPAKQQHTDMMSSFNVIGNTPMVLRESLLQEVYDMGERFVDTAKMLVSPGMNGPFCIEGVYDADATFYSFEFSARIVAGTNIYMEGSPYTTLMYDFPMSMGRRIALEVKNASNSNKLNLITT